ncbi:MAG: SpoIIE family protein phosphatase, partial [Spirochaetes bacterium]|nr:SpoIIE family protein phosphatase [Spirochaetota bacterium]
MKKENFGSELTKEKLSEEILYRDLDHSSDISNNTEKIKFSVKFKITLLTALLLLVVTLSIGFYLLDNIKKNLQSEMKLKAQLFTENLAQSMTEIFDDDTSRHEIIQKNKQTLRDIERIHVINPEQELIDSTDEETFQNIIKSKFDTRVKKRYIKIEDEIKEFLKKNTIYERSYKEDGFEKISFIAPVKIVNTFLGYVRIDFTKKYINKKIAGVQLRILIFVFIAIIIGITLSYILSSRLIKPIYKLSEGVRIIGNGNLNYKINIQTNDELKYLGEEFNKMTAKLDKAQRTLLEKERFEEQLEIARRIQENLLPEKFPDLKEVEISSYYKPARGVSGDYYDVIYNKEKNKLHAIIADVSGKGVPAALVMVMIRSILHSTLKFVQSANEAIQNINTGVTGKLTGDRFATIFYFDYNIKTGRLEYSNAAHSPLIVYKKQSDSIVDLDTPGVPIGVEASSSFGVSTTFLSVGDIIVGYTDGITEAMNINNEMFRIKTLKDIIRNNANKNASELKEIIIKEIENFVGSASQHDDMTMMIFKIEEVQSPTKTVNTEEIDKIISEVINPTDPHSL